MLSKQDNELLCRVGPGTPMGELMRRYWIPCLPSSEFPEPDGAPKRMRLLGENFVMFRDTEGRMGALAEACPHRGASLYFGRNEECGLRCPYHGWKFDLEGRCVDQPTEPPGKDFKHKVRARAYPCRDVNHMVWIYMGTGEPPPFPRHEVNTLPDSRVLQPNVMMEEANWMQNLEGDLDSIHLDFVHARLEEDSPAPPKGIRGFWNPDPNPPVLDVVAAPYGAFYSSARALPDGKDWHRINQFLFPFHTMISAGPLLLFRSFVPLDDHHAMLMTQAYHPSTAISEEMNLLGADLFDEVGGYIARTNDPRSYFLTVANKTNDYSRDLDVQKDIMYCGIPFVGNLPDRAMTELMCSPDGEPLYDRTQEHLGTSDAMVIAVRKQLITAARTLRDRGEVPENVANTELNRVRCGSFLLEKEADWQEITREKLSSDTGHPVYDEMPLILE
jgi:phenylpropionate dioxygenase-like ring-hydroxylating dioxygenase large terminal subunit